MKKYVGTLYRFGVAPHRSAIVIGAFLLALLLWHSIPASSVWAHGGVVIDSGYTEHFEWLVSVSPYPLATGEATVTLLVYATDTYEPVNDLPVSIYLAAPDAPRPCCQPNTHQGPIDLTSDPTLYPGDYSTVVNLNQAGDWEIQFVVDAGEKSFTIVVPITVAEPSGLPPTQEPGPPDVEATATAFAMIVQVARQSNSPLAAPANGQASPLATPAAAVLTSGEGPNAAAEEATGAGNLLSRWWLWGAAAVAPILLGGWLLLRSPEIDERDDEDVEDDSR
ncbi:MAG: hypothetical protein R3C14_19455 [Caldilineaceae bacterium]